MLEVHSRHVGGVLEDYVFCGDKKGWRCAVLGYGAQGVPCVPECHAILACQVMFSGGLGPQPGC